MAIISEITPYKANSTLTWQDLYKAKFTFDSPFKLELKDNVILHVEKVIRLVPRRRMIVFGLWQGKPIVAKMFFNPKRMKKHADKEIKGIKGLVSNNIPTPALYYHGFTPDKKMYILIFQRLINSKSPDDLWRAKKDVKEVYPFLESLILELATQHVLGVLQRDLHLKNFLLEDDILYTIDTAEVDIHPPLLSKELSMRNIAVLFSQLGVEAECYHDPLFRFYAKSRGWLLKESDFIHIRYLVKKTYEMRWIRHQRKIFRESTNASCFEKWNRYGMLIRIHAQPQFLSFMQDPETVFSRKDITILKNGNSSTVIKVKLDGRNFVVKRYNVKGVFHFLKRTFRETRARISWRLSHKLNLYGIKTAPAIAYIEKKFLGLHGSSYFVTEYVDGYHADLKHLQSLSNDQQTTIIEKISNLLKNITKAEVTHGDLKATNIMIDSHGHPILIDLDGAKEHYSISSLRSLWNREIKRFLKNFKSDTKLCQDFETHLK